MSHSPMARGGLLSPKRFYFGSIPTFPCGAFTLDCLRNQTNPRISCAFFSHHHLASFSCATPLKRKHRRSRRGRRSGFKKRVAICPFGGKTLAIVLNYEILILFFHARHIRPDTKVVSSTCREIFFAPTFCRHTHTHCTYGEPKARV